MPFIRVTTNVHLPQTKEAALRERIAGIVGGILGKDPVRMMTAFEGDMHLCRGPAENAGVPTAFVECKFFGGGDYEVFVRFDEAMKNIFRELLAMEPQNLYIKYEVINGWEEPARIFKI